MWNPILDDICSVHRIGSLTQIWGRCPLIITYHSTFVINYFISWNIASNPTSLLYALYTVQGVGIILYIIHTARRVSNKIFARHVLMMLQMDTRATRVPPGHIIMIHIYIHVFTIIPLYNMVYQQFIFRFYIYFPHISVRCQCRAMWVRHTRE